MADTRKQINFRAEDDLIEAIDEASPHDAAYPNRLRSDPGSDL